MDGAEVAAELGKTTKDVKNYVRRGRKKLAAFLREEVWNYCSSEDESAEELRALEGFFP